MNELVIRIGGDERIMVEETENGVKQVKFVLAEDLMQCIINSTEVKVNSGLLPDGCISYGENEAGEKYIAMLYREEKADTSYYQTEYPDFPLPRLVFGFHVTNEGRICRDRTGGKAGGDGTKTVPEAFRADVPVSVFQCQRVFPLYRE